MMKDLRCPRRQTRTRKGLKKGGVKIAKDSKKDSAKKDFLEKEPAKKTAKGKLTKAPSSTPDGAGREASKPQQLFTPPNSASTFKDFDKHLKEQEQSLGFQGQVLDKALEFAERWYHRGPVASTPAAVISEAKVVAAVPKTSEIAIEMASSQRKDIDFVQGWEVLNEANSWLMASEKNDLLCEAYGITTAEELEFLQASDIKTLAGKLKIVPARKLLAIFNLNN